MTAIPTEWPTDGRDLVPVLEPTRGIRIHWLNALIVGATILVWLTLIASVATGILLATAIGGSNGSTGKIDLTNDMVPKDFWVDNNGLVCAPPVTASGICP